MEEPRPAASSDPRLVEIGVGELAFGEAPKRLLTPALGSCVGVAIWDPMRHVGALAHVMLPTPNDTAVAEGGTLDRFASYAVPALVEGLHRSGSMKRRLVAKIAGGAAMFAVDTMLSRIGQRNIDEVKRQLALLHVPVVAEDTGGSHARTIELVLETGVLVVRSYQFGIKEL